MNDPPDLEALRGMFQCFLSDEEFRSEFARLCELALPEIGDEGATMKFLVTNLDHFDAPTKERPKFQRDLGMLLVDEAALKQRHQIAHAMGQRYCLEGKYPLMVAFASEAWTASSTGPRDELPDDLSTYPGRREAITLFASSLDQRTGFAQTCPTRGPDNKFTAFSDLELYYSFDPATHAGFNSMTPFLLNQFWTGYAKELLAKIAAREEDEAQR